MVFRRRPKSPWEEPPHRRGIEPSLFERILVERRAFALFLATLFLAVGSGVTVFVVKRGRAARESAEGLSAPAPDPELVPVQAPVSPRWETAGPEEVLLRGVLSFEDGLAPAANAMVVARTERIDIDYADTVNRLGGIETVRRLEAEGELEAKVRALGGWVPSFRGTSQPDGSFGLVVPRDLPPIRIEVAADFGAYLHPEWFDVQDPKTLSGITLRLEPAGKIEGVLRGPGGSLPRGGLAVLAPLEASAGGATPISEALADSQGRFAFRGVIPGEYEIVGVAEGCAPSAITDVRVHAGRAVRFELPLRAESVVSGRVGDAHGRPVAGAHVRLTPERWAWTPEVFATLAYGRTRTDDKGRFRLRSLRPGVSRIVAAAESHGESEARSLEVPEVGELHGIDLWCQNGASLTGVVLDARGVGLSGAEVTVQSAEGSRVESGFTRWVSTDSDGAFRFDGLPPGPFRLVARHEKEGAAEVAGTVPGSDGARVALPGPTGVQGRVRDARTQLPIERFAVRPVRHRAFTEGYVWEPMDEKVFESPQGAFACLDLPPGRYELEIRTPGYAPERTSVFEVARGEIVGPLSLPLDRGAAIRGKVKDGLTGTVVAGAVVRLVRQDGRPFFGAARRGDSFAGSALTASNESVRSRADGSFVFLDVPGGTVRLVARHPVYGVTETVPFEAVEGENLENVVLTYSRGGAVDGFAFGRDGRPMAGGAAVATPREPGQELRRAEISSTGYFRIEGLVAGDWRIQVAPAQTSGEELWRPRATREVDARVEVGRVTRVEFPPPLQGRGSLRGKVALGVKPLSGCWVSVQREAGREGPAVETAPDGTFLLEGVPGGDVLLRVELPNSIEGPARTQGAFETPVHVREGSETFVDLRLPQGRVEGNVTRAKTGTPVSGATVEVWPEGMTAAASQPRARAVTDPSGRFQCEALSAGPFFVLVRPPANEPRLADFEVHGFRIETQGVTPLEVELVVAGSLSVEVFDASAKPMRGAAVTLFETPQGSGGDELPRRRAQGTADGSGLVRFERLRPGDYLAVADSAGHAPAVSEGFTVLEDQETRVRLRLDPGVELRIRVGDSMGERVDAETIQVFDENGRLLPIPWRVPNDPPEARGTRIGTLAPGVYTITVRGKGYRPSTARVRLVEGLPFELPVVLRREGDDK